MRSIILALSVLSSLGLAACATSANAPIGVGGPIRGDGQARLNEPTRVGPLVFTPKEVVEDSRCPSGVQCVWAGRLVLLTRIDGPGWRQTIPLALGEDQPIGGHVVRLANARPAPVAGQPIAPGTYIFAFQLR
ncbi:hypothetical protein [Sphingomonas xanthus]|uniref:Lipoprotein n=1 Tax=Sphingomonas xanthus TaxID=2594473 RepID=A0A516ITQ7_9SPHN|nr:hypothetical protein [Sphingomonas xanthus]QDP20296.1 hypothetical protein FMM02_10240 [Sphingomonas xanthus]